MTIGIFDSGIGGKAVAMTLQAAFPDAQIITVNDRKHLPYGLKSPELIAELTTLAIQPLLNAACDVIVLACNTATSAAIELLRVAYPSQLFIGLEPMVKPAAALTRTGVIGVCATPATLKSVRYKTLKQKYAHDVRVVEPDCSTWATMIEKNQINQALLQDTVEAMLSEHVDVIVLACTHYHWIKPLIIATVRGRATVIDPSEAIAARLRSLLELR